MSRMFQEDEVLRTINVGSGWSTAAVEKSTMMFHGCENICGSQGTTYDVNHIDAAYAHVDGGERNPGYLSGDFLLGDVNGDGQVGIGDIVAITNVMAGTEQNPVIVSNADVNGDGQVGIGDIVAITNIMAGVK